MIVAATGFHSKTLRFNTEMSVSLGAWPLFVSVILGSHLAIIISMTPFENQAPKAEHQVIQGQTYMPSH